MDEGQSIARKIRDSQGEFICDGSLKHEMGTAAAGSIGEDEDSTIWVRQRTKAQTDELSAYRAELGGILAVVLMVQVICRRWDLHEGQVVIGCDCEPALWNVFGDGEVSTKMSGFNLIRIIRKEMRNTPIKWIARHVRGHQDEHKAMESLDRWETANVEADRRAKEYWTLMQDEEPPIWPNKAHPAEGWALYREGLPVESRIDDKIHQWTTGTEAIAYWHRKDRILEGTEEQVQWDLLGSATRGLQPGRQLWVAKHFSGWEGTGEMMQRWGKRDTSNCPRCPAKETHRHIVQCTSPGAQEVFDASMLKVTKWLQTSTSPDMQEAIVEMAQAYRRRRRPRAEAKWTRAVQRAVLQQNTVGTQAFMEGCWVEEWQYAHQGWLEKRRLDTCSRRWTIQLLRKMMLVSWDMWEARNGLVHSDQEIRKTLIRNQVHQRIRTLHKVGQRHRFLPPLDKEFFQQPVDQILKATEYKQDTWINQVQKILEKDERRLQANSEAAVMRRWLTTHNTQTHSH